MNPFMRWFINAVALFVAALIVPKICYKAKRKLKPERWGEAGTTWRPKIEAYPAALRAYLVYLP